jgi:hypothetical protein
MWSDLVPQRRIEQLQKQSRDGSRFAILCNFNARSVNVGHQQRQRRAGRNTLIDPGDSAVFGCARIVPRRLFRAGCLAPEACELNFARNRARDRLHITIPSMLHIPSPRLFRRVRPVTPLDIRPRSLRGKPVGGSQNQNRPILPNRVRSSRCSFEKLNALQHQIPLSVDSVIGIKIRARQTIVIMVSVLLVH